MHRLNVEEINPAELKFDLIKSADMKATVMLESELLPLRKQIRIIDESIELISTAEEQIESLKKEIGQIEAENQDLLLYKENLLENSKNLPEAVRQMNSMIIDKAASEIQANKDKLAVQRRRLTLVSSKLKKKMAFAIGEEYTTEQKNEYIARLQDQKAEVEKKMKTVSGKKDALVRLLNAQYLAEQKAELHSVPKLIEELSAKILKES